MLVKTLGIDLAKNIFQLHGIDIDGKEVLKKRLTRSQLIPFITNLPPCLIGMEACGGAHYWARTFKALGHEVRLMSPQHVKPYVKANKNDANDAKGICEAVSRPSMTFISHKSLEQQDIQCLHRVRNNIIQERTALMNQIRGLLTEYGFVLPQGLHALRKGLIEIIGENDSKLTPFMKELLTELYRHLDEKNKNLEIFDKKILLLSRQSETCHRLMKVEGIGPIIATALIAAVGDAKAFKNGRHMAAWLGLVPKQSSSGGKQKLLGISKRGDRYLRTLLIHGARSVVKVSNFKKDPRSQWINELVQRRGKFKTYVAVANKNARILWALMAQKIEYRSAI